jgi:hypothetical protein
LSEEGSPCNCQKTQCNKCLWAPGVCNYLWPQNKPKKILATWKLWYQKPWILTFLDNIVGQKSEHEPQKFDVEEDDPQVRWHRDQQGPSNSLLLV